MTLQSMKYIKDVINDDHYLSVFFFNEFENIVVPTNLSTFQDQSMADHPKFGFSSLSRSE